MKNIYILWCVAVYVPIFFVVGTFAEELPNIAGEMINLDNEDSFVREGRQLKWLQPASYVLSNLHKPLAPGEDPSGRFFKIMTKGNSVSQLEMFATVLKQALEDFNDDFKGFSIQYKLFVTNEVRRFAAAPSVAARFRANLAVSISRATTNLRLAVNSLLTALIALTQSLGINASSVLNNLNSGALGGLLSGVNSGAGGTGGLLSGLGLG